MTAKNIQIRSLFRKKSSSEVMEKMLKLKESSSPFKKYIFTYLTFKGPSDDLTRTGKPGNCLTLKRDFKHKGTVLTNSIFNTSSPLIHYQFLIYQTSVQIN